MILDLQKTGKFVVAFSGGSDSALLAFLLKEQKFTFRLVHVEHPNSKASKDGSQISEFCKSWAAYYDVQITCVKVEIDQFILKSKGIEAAERDARYDALYKELHQDETLLTGHHLDDSVETFLFRIARGSSAKGLSGIQKNSEKLRLIRPLISYSKNQIQSAVAAAAVLYGHDFTNSETILSRGFIRNKIVPLFVEHFTAPKFYASMKRVMENMTECSELMDDLYNIDKHQCGTNETGVNLVTLQNMSVSRQRNFLHHLFQETTGKYLSKAAIDEFLKQIFRKQNSTFSVSKVTVTIYNNHLTVQV